MLRGMATFTFTSAGDRFGIGATVSCYLASAQSSPGVAPSGAAVTTAVVASSGSLTFTGLADDTAYVAWDGTHGRRFRTEKFETEGVVIDASLPPYNVTPGTTDQTANVQRALDAANAAVTVFDDGATGKEAVVILPIGYIKVTGLTIGSFTTLKGRGERTILQLTGASDANLIQGKNYGSATLFDNQVRIENLRLIGNSANQSTNLAPQTKLSADVAVGQVGTTLNVLDTTGFAAAGTLWVGYDWVTYTGKTGTSFTGVTQAGGSTYNLKKGMWVTPTNGKGHLIAMNGKRCRFRDIFGDTAVSSGIYLQGPDPIASGGQYGAENVIAESCRFVDCGRYGLEIGQNVPDGQIEHLVAGGYKGGMLVRSADWMFNILHFIGNNGSPVRAIPQALLIAASDFRGNSIYYDTYPGTRVVIDCGVQGLAIKDTSIGQQRSFQCSWGAVSGGQGVLFRGAVKAASTIARAAFINDNQALSPFACGYANGPFARTVGVQNLTALVGGKLQVLNAMDFEDSSAQGGPLAISTDTNIAYTGRQMSFAKLTADAAPGDAVLNVDSTAGFDASGTITVFSENGDVFTPMVVTYTGKTATTFTGCTGVLAALSTGERGTVSQHFFTGVSGGTLTNVTDLQSVTVDAGIVGSLTGLLVVAPQFRSFRVSRMRLQTADTFQITPGTSADRPMRTMGTASIAVGQTTAVVAHGLGEVPRRFATPTVDPQQRWWVTADATNLTFTLAAAAAGSAVTFDWAAEVF